MENVGVTPGTITSHQVNLGVRPDQTDIYIIVLMSKTIKKIVASFLVSNKSKNSPLGTS